MVLRNMIGRRVVGVDDEEERRRKRDEGEEGGGSFVGVGERSHCAQ